MTTTKRGHCCSRSAFGKVRFSGHISKHSKIIVWNHSPEKGHSLFFSILEKIEQSGCVAKMLVSHWSVAKSSLAVDTLNAHIVSWGHALYSKLLGWWNLRLWSSGDISPDYLDWRKGLVLEDPCHTKFAYRYYQRTAVMWRQDWTGPEGRNLCSVQKVSRD